MPRYHVVAKVLLPATCALSLFTLSTTIASVRPAARATPAQKKKKQKKKSTPQNRQSDKTEWVAIVSTPELASWLDLRQRALFSIHNSAGRRRVLIRRCSPSTAGQQPVGGGTCVRRAAAVATAPPPADDRCQIIPLASEGRQTSIANSLSTRCCGTPKASSACWGQTTPLRACVCARSHRTHHLFTGVRRFWNFDSAPCWRNGRQKQTQRNTRLALQDVTGGSTWLPPPGFHETWGNPGSSMSWTFVSVHSFLMIQVSE